MVTLLLALPGCESDSARVQSGHAPRQIVSMRRLTEAQYRNTIADIFGSGIKVAGRFEPIVRPAQHLLSTGATAAAVSPVGLEQFDGVARVVAEQVFDEAHRDTFVECTPRDAAKSDDKCARKTLVSIGRYVFRRPLTAHEQRDYARMADEAASKAGSFYSGLELSLAAMLVSPNFLFVSETVEPDPGHPGMMRLDNYSRASHLSFLLWDTTPNDTLLTAAAKGQLTDQAKLDAIAARMAASPRLEDGVRAFFADMLVYEKFEADDYAKDPLVMARRSVLSGVEEQRKAFEAQLGASDKQRLDQYFTSLRQLEKQLDIELTKPQPLEACRVPSKPTEAPVNAQIENVLVNHKLMTQLLVMAMACDQTRVFNMYFNNGASSLTRVGSTTTHHQLTHEEQLDQRLGYQPNVTFFVEKIMGAWVDFIAALDAVKEGDGTLLDHTLVFAHSETDFAKFHTIDSIPMMTAGSASGRVKTGIHVKGMGTPVSRVGLTLQQVMGVPVDKWGTASMQTNKPITEILI